MSDTIYQQKGFKDRMDYLEELALEYNVNLYAVLEVAELMGEEEDFDGLVSMVRDFSGM